MTKTKEGPAKRRVSGSLYLIVMVCAALLALVFSSVISAVTDRIVEANVASMEELMKHDVNSIYNSLNLRWSEMEAVAERIAEAGYTTSEEAISALKERLGYVSSAEYLMYVDSDGIVYRNSGLVAKDAYLPVLCSEHTGRFAARYNDTSSAWMETRREMLVLGVPVDLDVGEIHFDWLLCRLNISTLENELKIDSYNSEGFSSVIDKEGNYIVNVSSSHSLLIYDNFFEDLKDAKFEGGTSIDALCASVSATADVKSAIYTQNGRESVMIIGELDFASWYFITTVPMSVFDTQTNAILQLFMLLLAIILIIAIAVFVLIVKQRQQNTALEMEKEKREQEAAYKEQLQQALDMAHAASRAKTVFLNNMSHDIRTPMNAIIGFTDIAAKYLDDPVKTKEYLGKIGTASKHLLSLINDVLDMSRIESGKVTIHEDQENLPDIIHGLHDIIMADINNKNQELYINTAGVSDENIICDRLRLNQVLLNLVSNSVKYTGPNGTISIQISQLGRGENGYGTYEFRVKDNGIGMDEEFLKTIFDPFTRAKSTTVSGIQGTGLGMAITKNLVDMMGGTIQVESEEGVGTEFIVTLPFKIYGKSEDDRTIRSLEGLRALVVDDDLNACQSVASMLRQIGMRPEWTAYGKEAVVRTQEAVTIGDRFDLYIIDWLIPDMNGIETARQIRKVVGDDITIILLSAYDYSEIETEAKEAGITGFISKPIFMTELYQKLSSCCKEEAGEVTQSKTEEKPENADFSGISILLVEDNELNMEISMYILQENGMIVDTAEDGTIAVEKVKHAQPGQYDCILMDIQMPNMDGYEATRRIRKLPDKGLAEIPIIAMTADAFAEDKEKALQTGMNAHVTKPVDVQQLKEALRNVLSGSC
ncbi:MAG: response regulator [Eubacteriales bacterium]|nr:response regulator [Eubacteriales bacterium]